MIIPIKQHVFKWVLAVISASSAGLRQHTELDVIQVLKGKAVKSNKYLNKASLSERALRIQSVMFKFLIWKHVFINLCEEKPQDWTFFVFLLRHHLKVKLLWGRCVFKWEDLGRNDSNSKYYLIWKFICYFELMQMSVRGTVEDQKVEKKLKLK